MPIRVFPTLIGDGASEGDADGAADGIGEGLGETEVSGCAGVRDGRATSMHETAVRAAAKRECTIAD
jgi:hypothetical protein